MTKLGTQALVPEFAINCHLGSKALSGKSFTLCPLDGHRKQLGLIHPALNVLLSQLVRVKVQLHSDFIVTYHGSHQL